MNRLNQFIRKNKYKLIKYIVLLIGCMIRILFITDFPNALNVDEASSGYEAFSILNYGIDRNGNFMPVFLESWGSGQNALYTYLIIPFVKILGLNILSIRLPMAIISCISLFVMCKILEKITNKKTAIIGLIFFSITPWHIMKSRWGLESNLFPDIILFASYFIIKYIQTKEIKNMYIVSFFLGISAYSYGTSYFFLPLFVLGLLACLRLKKEIDIKHCIGIMLTISIISLPIILFVVINKFHLEPIKLFFTIPILSENRFEEMSSIFSSNFIKNSLTNFKESILILVKQDDGLRWNELEIYGLIYINSLPFTLLGIYLSFKAKEKEKWVFNIWSLAAFLLLFVIKPNVNRINIIMMPIIYYTIIGLAYVIEKVKYTKLFFSVIYLSLFIMFQISYYKIDWNEYSTFNNGVENVIKYVDNMNAEKIYFAHVCKEPYIYVCFYNNIDTREFVDTVKYKDSRGFDRVESFGKYYFYIPEVKEENVVYVVKAQDEEKYGFKNNEWNKKYIDNFVIIY